VANVSYWLATRGEAAGHPPLDGDRSVDAVVIGGGIVGVTTAYLLRRSGLSVALVEMDHIGAGASGYTTAKLTVGHGLIYRELERLHGEATARAYASANREGLDLIRHIVEDEDIECDLEPRANYVYATSPNDADVVTEEVEACSRVGLPAVEVSDLPLPYPTSAAVRIADQAQFHPVKYLDGLTRRFVDGGGQTFELTRVMEVSEQTAECVVKTDRGTLLAEHVVIATHYPFVDRALLFPRVHPKRSYAIAGVIDESRLPDGMFISCDQPTRSIRTIRDADRTLLMVGGEGHAVGQEPDTEARYGNLEEWARAHFGMSEITHRWSTQDGVSVDRVPYIGTYHGTARVRVATGFGKWGFTNGTIGAKVMTDDILGLPSPFAELYDPKRVTVKASAASFVRENAKVALHFAADRVLHPQRLSLDDLAPGEAAVDRLPLKPIAGYRDEHGRLHKVSAVCTHLKCIVTWNNAERSWDCPCHGSRFDVDGRVIEGPAVKDLDQVD
jgi:glycine/D-amino acid oxidase-like deaminating enzyme/nitrite reductase/ring-hydroxylating ferredoxin subunit